MTDMPKTIWAKAQEWPKGSGRIVVYADAQPDPDERQTAYRRADLPPKVKPLVDAARAVIARWDSTEWKAAPTADVMNDLRAALDAIAAV